MWAGRDRLPLPATGGGKLAHIAVTALLLLSAANPPLSPSQAGDHRAVSAASMDDSRCLLGPSGAALQRVRPGALSAQTEWTCQKGELRDAFIHLHRLNSPEPAASVSFMTAEFAADLV